MEPNYIKSVQSAQKGKEMAMQLENSPMDKHKMIHGDGDQGHNLLVAKEQSD